MTNVSPSHRARESPWYCRMEGETCGPPPTEKFRRVAADTLEYYVTFDDPAVWSRPWTLMIPLKMTGEQMFEYACHEGNYGLPAILRGAREQEKQSTR